MNKRFGSERQMLLPPLDYFWIVLFESLLGDLPDALEVDSEWQFQTTFSCQLIFTGFYATPLLAGKEGHASQGSTDF